MPSRGQTGDRVDRWQRYLDVMEGRVAEGSAGTVVFVVPVLDLERGSEATRAAVALAVSLADQGHGVRLVGPRASLAQVEGLRAVVSLVPRAGVRMLPPGITALAWCLTDVDAWLADPVLDLYDAVLAPSVLAQRALAAQVTAPVHLLAPGVDARLLGEASAAWRVQVEAPTLEHRRWGIVPPGLLDALASGAQVTAPSWLGAVHLGLASGDPNRSDDGSRRFTATPDDVLAAHSWDVRALALRSILTENAGGGRARPLIGCFPEWVSENPYQQLLYSGAVADGVRVVPVHHPERSAAPRDDGGRLNHYVLHVHWTAPLLQPCAGPVEALERLDAFKANVIDLRSRGGRLLWTVHNVLPHDVRWWTLEVELARFLADQADLIHVLDDHSLDLVRPLFDLPPEKVVVVPHSSYVGVYPDVVRREDARARLGLEADEPTLLMLGGLRPYKGLGTLLDAFDELLTAVPRARLLIAGKPAPGGAVDADLRRAMAHPRVLASPGFIPDEEVQVWFRASDVCVLPYRDVLNSGSFQLALTFGTPVVVPALGSLRFLADIAFARTFEPGARGSLAEALRSALAELVPSDASAAAHAAAVRNGPERMARAFHAALLERLPGLVRPMSEKDAAVPRA